MFQIHLTQDDALILGGPRIPGAVRRVAQCADRNECYKHAKCSVSVEILAQLAERTLSIQVANAHSLELQ